MSEFLPWQALVLRLLSVSALPQDSPKNDAVTHISVHSYDTLRLRRPSIAEHSLKCKFVNSLGDLWHFIISAQKVLIAGVYLYFLT
jgi:hypothetical protein